MENGMQKKENFVTDNEDILFHLEHKIDFRALYKLALKEDLESLGITTADEYVKTWREVFEQMGEVAGTVIAPNARQVAKQDLTIDANGDVVFPSAIQSNLDSLAALGFAATGIPSKFGGMAAPLALELAAVEIIYRACPSTLLNVCWFSSVARVIESFCTEEQKERVIPRIASGEWSGSMGLTEPDAGSDLGAIRTYGELQPDGKWKLYGTKRFISNGCSEVGLVLAKGKKGAEGLGALNMYLCLRHKDDGSQNYKVTKLEEKPGLHGSATCELAFDGSVAELIGEEGKGFHYMLHLMNEARVAVALQGIGVSEAVYRLAADYCNERKAWGRPLAQHELVAEKLLDMEVELKASRSLCYQGAYAAAVVLMASRKLKQEHDSLSEEERTEIEELRHTNERRLRRWTPLMKYWQAEAAVRHARTCMQLHGGYGYTTEYLPEWWMRESLIIPVYEGTSQIQALMALKDTMKAVIRRPGKFIEIALGTSVQALAERNPLRRKLHKLRQTANRAILALIFRLVKTNVRDNFSDVKPSDIRSVIKILTKEIAKFENLRPALLQAERICEINALVAMAESVLRDASISPERAWIAERWLNKSLLRADFLKSEIEMDEPVIEKRLEAFPAANMTGM
jgi:alkylation response protein AidB-like acyl-CoA dehydrogenase